MAVPRGIRNNNPGNIERNAKDKWQGLAADQSADKRFAVFSSSVYGIRALARILINYQDDHSLRTIRKIITRWAPPKENKTDAYIADVAANTGFGPDQDLNLHTFEHLAPLVKAIIQHENGQQPYTDAQIAKALVLAGVEPAEPKTLQASRTIKGAQVASAGVTLTAVSEMVTQVKNQIEPLIPYAHTLKFAFLAMALIGIGIAVYARIDDAQKGLR